jgi:hypothetical protein
MHREKATETGMATRSTDGKATNTEARITMKVKIATVIRIIAIMAVVTIVQSTHTIILMTVATG